MTLYKSWMNAIVRHSRPFVSFVHKGEPTWFKALERHPEVKKFLVHPTLSEDQWIKFKSKVKDNAQTNGGISLNVVIMQLCVAQRNYDLGKSFMKYLIENKTEMIAALVGKYFHLLYNGRETITENDKREILRLYRDLRVKYPLLDGTTAENCILAISLTEQWRETEELLEVLKISCDNASRACYSAIVVAAYKDGDPDIGWKYLEEMGKLKKKPTTEAYVAVLEYLENATEPDDRVKEIEKIFNFLARHNLLPDKIAIEHIKRMLENLGWVGSFTTLSHTGICNHCQNKLAPSKLSEEEFSDLSKSVFDRLIVGKDIYSRSTPTELNRFVHFVNGSKPYDVVIDGLNVMYRSRGNSKNSTAAEQLARLVRYLLDMNKVVLVLGRKHMMGWDEKSMNYIKNNAFLFLVNDLSKDDPYVIYATLASGPETIFFSYDMMRGHKSILKDARLERVFKQWQMSHQCDVNFRKNKMLLTWPLSYLPVAQKGDNCWHIPYQLSQELAESYHPPDDWLCLLRRSNSRS